MRFLSVSLAFALLALPASAQTPAPSWEPWLGCWELTFDVLRESPAPGDTLRNGTSARRTGNLPRVCVSAVDRGGARFVTTLSGQAPVEYTTVPDGTARPLEDGECRGTQRAEWSADGLRVFSRAELTCQGDPAPRRISGLSLFAPNGTWLDIQAVDVGGRESVRVRRYYRVEGEPIVPRPTVAASVLTVDDVKEAGGKTAARAIEAALVETNAGFNLTASSVIELDDAGVPDSVIDLMVALSYPDRFVVERTSRGGVGAGPGFIDDPFMLGWAFGYPVGYYDYFYSPYYYMPFGYSSYALRGYGGPYLGDVTAGPAQPRPSGAGRVVDGQGYTRVRTREAAITDQGGRQRTSAVADTTSSSSSSSSSSGSSGASSGGGYTAGTSSGDTGRTAQPR